MGRKFLNIENCIVMHDLKQIKKETAEKKIKTINKLAILLSKDKGLNLSKSAISSKLYRYEKTGFDNDDELLIKSLLRNLEVSLSDLIKES